MMAYSMTNELFQLHAEHRLDKNLLVLFYSDVN
jgi:hypothetical protein